MRIKAEYRHSAYPPLLILNIHNAPHRRMGENDDRILCAVLTDYRKQLREACFRAGLIILPIDYPIDLSVSFIDPASPDLGNSFLMLERCMDKNIVADDSLIQAVTMFKMSPNAREPYKKQPLNLPRFSIKTVA
jgi:hypothetical protein